MLPVRRISFTDLSPNARQFLENVRQGETVLLEEGEDEAVIVDITDYRLLRAALHAVAKQTDLDPDAGLSEETLPASVRPCKRDTIPFSRTISPGALV